MMRFIVDECSGPSVARWLQAQMFEVYSVFDESPGMKDEEILEKARIENFILITNDSDFGEMIYREGVAHYGVIFLRLRDQRSESKIKALQELLKHYREDLIGNFVVVTETQVRFGR